MVGTGKPVDSDKHFVVCINTLGSCFGSTSPVSINESTEKPYRLSFPELTVEDMATASNMLLDKLGINSINVLIGPSLGGMQALAYSLMFNICVRNTILISTATQATPYAIAIRSLQREVIRKDPDWNNGFYSHFNNFYTHRNHLYRPYSYYGYGNFGFYNNYYNPFFYDPMIPFYDYYSPYRFYGFGFRPGLGYYLSLIHI